MDKIDGDSWFIWWFHLPGPSISSKRSRSAQDAYQKVRAIQGDEEKKKADPAGFGRRQTTRVVERLDIPKEAMYKHMCLCLPKVHVGQMLMYISYMDCVGFCKSRGIANPGCVLF